MTRYSVTRATYGVVLGCLFLLNPMIAKAVCTGDCNNGGTVSISEVQRCANIFLGSQLLSTCTNCDRNSNGIVSIAEVQAAANGFLNAATCPQVTPPAGGSPTSTNTVGQTANTPTNTPTLAVPTPTNTQGTGAAVCGNGVKEGSEECDDGGTCIDAAKSCQGGPKQGTACALATAAADCGIDPASGEPFPCFGNPCTKNSDCGVGTCVPFGGDGCAANCTLEHPANQYRYTGARCFGGANSGVECSLNKTCAGGSVPGKVCTKNTDCTGGGICQSPECGAAPGACFAVGECTAGDPTKVASHGVCGAPSGTIQPKFCVGGGSDLLPCNQSTQCPGGGSCTQRCSNLTTKTCTKDTDCTGTGKCNVNQCSGGANNNKACNPNIDCTGGICGNYCSTSGGAAADGVCVPKTAATLQSLVGIVLTIGPLIGGQEAVYGAQRDNDGLIPIAVPATGVHFAPVKVPGLVCACVRGAAAPDVFGPHNSGAGMIACGSTGIPGINVTLSSDHNTTPPNTCLGGSNDKGACNPNADCPSGTCDPGLSKCVGGTSNGNACSQSSQCAGGGSCNVNNGPGTCVGGSARNGLACGGDSDCGGTAGACKNRGLGGGMCIGGTNNQKVCLMDSDCPGAGAICDSPDDATCTRQDLPPPAGSGRAACGEAKSICINGPLDGQPCTSDAGCGGTGSNGLTCGVRCNTLSLHPGVCNSPVHISNTGIGTTGDGLIVTSTAIGVIADGGSCGFQATCTGGGFPNPPVQCTGSTSTCNCIGGACLKGCTVDAECTAGTCAGAFCEGLCQGDPATNGNPCVTSAACGGGSGVCTPGPTFGQACTGAAGECSAGVCTPLLAADGFDGLPCTADDPPSSRGAGLPIPTTTGIAAATIVDANNVAGQLVVDGTCTNHPEGCTAAITGRKFNCAAFFTGVTTGTKLVAAFQNVDQAQVQDNVVTNGLEAK